MLQPPANATSQACFGCGLWQRGLGNQSLHIEIKRLSWFVAILRQERAPNHRTLSKVVGRAEFECLHLLPPMTAPSSSKRPSCVRRRNTDVEIVARGTRGRHPEETSSSKNWKELLPRAILNLDHESKLSQLEAALAALGLRVSVSVTKVSPAATSMAA